jgi:hypothetical protein
MTADRDIEWFTATLSKEEKTSCGKRIETLRLISTSFPEQAWCEAPEPARGDHFGIVVAFCGSAMPPARPSVDLSNSTCDEPSISLPSQFPFLWPELPWGRGHLSEETTVTAAENPRARYCYTELQWP